MIAQEVITRTEEQLINEFFKNLLIHDNVFNKLDEEEAIKHYKEGEFGVLDSYFGVSAKVEFSFQGHQVHPVFMEFDEMILITQFSGFVYKLQRMSGDNWLRTYEGKFNGLNSQTLIVDPFIMDKENILIDSTYGNTLSYSEYLTKATLYKELREDELSFEQAIRIVNPMYDNTLLDEEDVMLEKFGFNK